MDTKQIIDVHVRVLEAQKEALRKDYLDELKRLGQEALAAEAFAPTHLAWIEMAVEKLREIQGELAKLEAMQVAVRSVADRVEFAAEQAEEVRA